MSKNGNVKYTVKERLDELNTKIETVNHKVENLQLNDVRNISVDLAELRGQLIYIKWFILAVLGIALTSLIRLWMI